MDSIQGSAADAMRAAQAESNTGFHGYKKEDTPFSDVANAEAEEERPAPTMEDLVHAIRKQPLHKHLYRRVLIRLQDEATTEEMEAYISELPEFAYAVQPEARFLDVLERAGGIERVGQVPESAPIPDDSPSEAAADPDADPDAGEEAAEEAADTLQGVIWKTTDLGTSYVAQTEPAEKLNELFMKEPERKNGYLTVVAACAAGPKKLSELVAELERRKGEEGDAEGVHPSVYLDRLEAAGIITWDEAWALTDEGKSCAAAYLAESSDQQ